MSHGFGMPGVLTQLSIVFGIMFTQIAGINLAAPSSWRYVFFLSFCLSALQLLSASFVVESPAFLFHKGHVDQYKNAARRLWGNTTPTLADCKAFIQLRFLAEFDRLLLHKLKLRCWTSPSHRHLLLENKILP